MVLDYYHYPINIAINVLDDRSYVICNYNEGSISNQYIEKLIEAYKFELNAIAHVPKDDDYS